MRSFIDKKGRVLTVGGDHTSYCRYVLSTTLAKYVRDNIRVKQSRDILCIETLQKYITDDQFKTIRKLYKDYRCLELLAGVNRIIYYNFAELRKTLKK